MCGMTTARHHIVNLAAPAFRFSRPGVRVCPGVQTLSRTVDAPSILTASVLGFRTKIGSTSVLALPFGVNRRVHLIELPERDPCDLCEGMAGREERWAIIDESEHTLTVINPWQFEIGQCCVITRRHVATLLEISPQECAAVMLSAKRVAEALVKAYQPLGILTFQNNGVFSGQETPHFHFHVVPRQQGSEWGVGPPQLAIFDDAGRRRGTPHDSGGDALRRERVRVSQRQLTETAALIRLNLPR